MSVVTILLLLYISAVTAGRFRVLQEDSWNGDPFKDFITGENCFRKDKNTEELWDFSNWMSKLENADELRLMDLTLPGTHNSGSYNLTNQVNEGDPSYAVVRAETDMPDFLLAQWICKYALTQSLSLSEQLKAGVRFIDLRLDYDTVTESFRNSHMLFGKGAMELLDEVATFAKEHPKEIIILELPPLEVLVDDQKKVDLQKMITDYFAGLLIPTSTNLATVTIGELQESGKNVLAVVHDDVIVGNLDTIWHENIILQTYPNTDDVDRMIEYNNANLDNFLQYPQEELYKIQWILTPGEEYIKMNPFEGSLYTLAEMANSKLAELSSVRSLLGNIVIVDYFESSSLMEALGYVKYSDGPFDGPIDSQPPIDTDRDDSASSDSDNLASSSAQRASAILAISFVLSTLLICA